MSSSSSLSKQLPKQPARSPAAEVDTRDQAAAAGEALLDADPSEPALHASTSASSSGSVSSSGPGSVPASPGGPAASPAAVGCPACRLRWEGKGEPLAPGESRSGKFTVCDVLLHSSPTDCFLHAHGKVYDVTPFLHDHPGGKGSILRHAGRNSSTDFDFHSAGAQGEWRRLEVGRIVPCPGHPDAGEGWASTCTVV
jgi:hypothetical protein